jgi:hypothetical protein
VRGRGRGADDAGLEPQSGDRGGGDADLEPERGDRGDVVALKPNGGDRRGGGDADLEPGRGARCCDAGL